MSGVHFLVPDIWKQQVSIGPAQPMQKMASRIVIEKEWLHILFASHGDAVTAAHIVAKNEFGS
ncbi:MAG: hypothetical protein Q9224_007582, partial [Gallowayella concinna]